MSVVRDVSKRQRVTHQNVIMDLENMRVIHALNTISMLL